MTNTIKIVKKPQVRRFLFQAIIIFCFSLSVAAATLTPPSGALPSAAVGLNYVQSFVGTAQLSSSSVCTMTTTWVNGTNGLNFSVTGVAPTLTGTLAGIATSSPATYNFSVTFRCTNGGGNQPETITNNYTLNVVTVTSASSNVSGRVYTTSGRFLSRARLAVLDMDGNLVQTVTSNQFGYYRINGLESGRTFLIAVVSKRYQFNNQIITPSEEFNSIDFVAIQ
jgi:Carboxypeptidase regulatory-like domain